MCFWRNNSSLKQFDGTTAMLQEGKYRICGLKDVVDETELMIFFVVTLLRDNIELPSSFELKIQRTHCALASEPPREELKR